jgi:hypothetical protein
MLEIVSFSAVLRAAMAANRYTRRETAYRAGIKPYRLDNLYWGRYDPRPEERVALERVLPLLPVFEHAMVEAQR